MKSWVHETADVIRSKYTAANGLGVIPNIAHGEESAEDMFGPNVQRLREVKAKYDPDGVWKKGVRI